MDLGFKTLQKIENSLKPRNFQTRSSSYPYLCWDTYFELSDLRITNSEELEILRNTLEIKDVHLVYVLTEIIEPFEKIVMKANHRIHKLIIGESDDHNPVSRLIPLLAKVDKIYANHLIGDNSRITALPVGIERQSYNSGGKIKDFKKKVNTDPNARKIVFLVAWNDATNTNRSLHKKEFEESERALIIRNRVNASTFHNILRKTLFVPCPAGNGIDTHRVWESIYLGAVPVILKNEFCGDESCPVLVVPSWKFLIEKNMSELHILYKQHRTSKEQAMIFSKKLLEGIKI